MAGVPVARTTARTALVFAAGYFLAALLPLWVAADNVPFPPFYPPVGILFATLVLTQRRTWPLWLLLTFPLAAGAHIVGGRPFADTVVVVVADSVSATLGAYLVGRFGGWPFRLHNLRSLAILIGLGGVSAAVPGAVVGGILLNLMLGIPILDATRSTWVFILLGVVIVAPAILLWDSTWPRRWFERARGIEFCGLAGASITVPAAVYFLPELPILSLIMVPLIWAAVRFGPMEAAAANLALAIMTMASDPLRLSSQISGEFTPLDGMFYLQMFLVFMAVGPSLVVATALLEREKAGAALEQGENRLRALLDNSPMVITVRDIDGRYLTVNQKYIDWYGNPLSGDRASAVADVFPADVSGRVADVTARVVAERRAIEDEYAVTFRDGEDHLVRVTHFPIVSSAGSVVAVGAIGSDVTEARRAEEQLRQAQKMEAIGQLTGGIAHDFNNLLAVVIGNLELVLEEVPPEDKSTGRTRIALNAAERGAALTQRLLAFSRKQALKPEVLDVRQVVEGMQAILSRTLGEQITFVTAAEPGLWACEADKAQFEAALLNLAINARDAMPMGGTLSIEAANVHLDEHYASAQVDLEAGDYVMIAVADTGEGMAAEVRERAFDPFFSTKSKGQGSGLGLAMVHGFVKQSGGHVSLYSELGHGTTVKIYLPRSSATLSVPESGIAGDASYPMGRQERVLVVEDDDDVRALTKALLTELGYQVIAAHDGESALDQLSQHAELDLLLTDVVLAGSMSGRDVADAASRSHPQLAVLYMSGYTANVVVKQGRLDSHVELLHKPFHRSDLARAARRVLDRADASRLPNESPETTSGDR